MGRTKLSSPVRFSRTRSGPRERDTAAHSQHLTNSSPFDRLRRSLSGKRHDEQAFTSADEFPPAAPRPVLYTHPNGALQLGGASRTRRHIGEHPEEESFKGITASGKEIRVPHNWDHEMPRAILSNMSESVSCALSCLESPIVPHLAFLKVKTC